KAIGGSAMARNYGIETSALVAIRVRTKSVVVQRLALGLLRSNYNRVSPCASGIIPAPSREDVAGRFSTGEKSAISVPPRLLMGSITSSAMIAQRRCLDI